ncbi:MAG: AmmeMemoRadiSam system protein B [Candidatus Marinimicrobia bacterium]|nr:AmmeMemoRadiSam system protein B [Candidatus Neomarinimicrobiota bacterium]
MSYREAQVAGQFYPGIPGQLREMLGELFRLAGKDAGEVKAPVAGIVAPHAGYVFSGLQAAKAYQYLKGSTYRLVCILSPSHREYFSGISLYSGEGYRTPLGECPVHSQGRDEALKCGGVSLSEAGHRSEHALEVQLPFLQYVLGDLQILPMVMGDQDAASIRNAAHCVRHLHEQFGEDILFVASSDLSHFHPAEEARKMDTAFMSMLETAGDVQILEAVRQGQVEACGAGPVLAVLQGLGKEAHSVRVLGYSHSGEVTGGQQEVVGYTSALILRTGGDPGKGHA